MLVPVCDGERVAVDGDVADGRRPKRLLEGRRDLDVVPLPQPGEFRAPFPQLPDEVGNDRVGRVARLSAPQLRHNTLSELDVVADSVDRGWRLPAGEEGFAREVAIVGLDESEVFHQGCREVVPCEHLERCGKDDPCRER